MLCEFFPWWCWWTSLAVLSCPLWGASLHGSRVWKSPVPRVLPGAIAVPTHGCSPPLASHHPRR